MGMTVPEAVVQVLMERAPVKLAFMELAHLVKPVPLAELTGVVLAEAAFPHRAALVLLEEV